MFDSIKKLIYYLWNRETKDEHDERIAEAKAVQDESDRRNRERTARWEAEWQIEKERLAAVRQAKRDQERAYQEFLKTNEVTRSDSPVLDDKEIREQRRRAMRFAKDMQDGMSD